MNVTYLTTVQLPEGMAPEEISETGMDIADELASSGFDVVSVVPWARPALGLTPQSEELPPPLF